jgi:hypothetical protein
VTPREPTGLSEAQREVLSALRDGWRSGLDPFVRNRLLTRLSRLGLVERVTALDPARWRITTAGMKALYEETAAAGREALREGEGDDGR